MVYDENRCPVLRLYIYRWFMENTSTHSVARTSEAHDYIIMVYLNAIWMYLNLNVFFFRLSSHHITRTIL